MIEKVEKTKDKLWDILAKITKKEIQIFTAVQWSTAPNLSEQKARGNWNI